MWFWASAALLPEALYLQMPEIEPRTFCMLRTHTIPESVQQPSELINQ